MRMLLFVCVTLAACSPVMDRPAAEVSAANVTVYEYAALGDPAAPITFVEFSDYQCPFCKKFTEETLPLLLREYVYTGEVRFVFKDFPLEIHDDARQAAVAAHCAGEQEMYFPYHDILFANSRNITEENLIMWAEELSLDTPIFTSCLSNPEQYEKVNQSINEARELGVRGTPSFLVNNQFVTGALPYELFQSLIEDTPHSPVVDNATCTSDADCPSSRTFPSYCSGDKTAVCTTTMTPTCSLPGRQESSCVTVIVEECTPCNVSCSEGACS